MSELTLTIKCSNADKATVVIESTATVLDLKQKIAEQLEVPATQQRLIYKGRVLKDESTLENYDIQNEHTVHMVKGAAPAGSTPAPVPTSSAGSFVNPQQNAFGAPPAFGAPQQANPMGMFGGMPPMGPGGMPDMNRMQEQLMRNPEMMRQVMSSPMMENLLNNPDMLRNMMMSNPQMQAMMDANPQMRHILNDPSVLRQSMEMMRNPNAMREAMRSQDLQMSQLENIPGGFNAMRRMFEDVQEPMMEASQSMNQANTTTNTSNTTSTTNTSTAPTNTALPNPWGGAPANTNTNNAMGSINNPFAQMGGAGGFNPYAGMGGMGGMGGFGGQDPAQAAQMLQNPMVQQMMQQMLNDPQALEQMAAMNPELGAALQNPQMRAMLTNPDFMRRMADPNTMQAMMQMQQSMAHLQGSGLFPPNTANPALGAPGANPFNPFANPYANPFANPYANPYGGFGAGGGAAGGLNFNSLFIQPTGTGAPAPSAAPAPAPVDPAVRYANQLQQLQDMGFGDAEANLQALVHTRGNVNNAVERLLGGGV